VGDLVDVQLPAVLRVPEVPDVEAGQNLKKKHFINKYLFLFLKTLAGTKLRGFAWRQDIQHNDNLQNSTQHNDLCISVSFLHDSKSIKFKML
jgi:hypothetical protein